MAGNIIPAIATTNAIVAGMIVLLAFKVLSSQLDKCKYTYLSYSDNQPRLLLNESIQSPNPYCGVCSSTYLMVILDTNKKTLGDLLEQVIQDKKNGLGIEGDISIEEGGR
jgi:ubiquitin-like 1-activating enzyme E1 B